VLAKGKALLMQNDIFEAYNHIVAALHHL